MEVGVSELSHLLSRINVDDFFFFSVFLPRGPNLENVKLGY